MLLRFRAANVLSFRHELELSLLPGPVARGSSAGIRTVGKELAALPLAVIYGPNASGKTNVLAAMRWMVDAVTGSVAAWATHSGVPRPAFALDPEAATEASLFEVDVVLDEIRYVYGFEVSDHRVETEWLHAYPRGRKQVWFERDAAMPDPYHFPSERFRGNRQHLIEATRPNSLFLTVGAQFNHPQLRPLHNWFSTNLVLISSDVDPRRRNLPLGSLREGATRSRLESLLRSADLGISGIEVVERDGAPQVRLLHHGQRGEVALDFDRQESLGTLAWFAFLGPMLAALDSGTVLLVDELDSSLHSSIVAEILRLFRDPSANPDSAQLICTVHDVSLLGGAHSERPLFRDEVWLVEKRRTGESELFPLTDAKPRPDESLERGYLRGRYGALPMLPTNWLAAEVARRTGTDE
jgi:predicted ATPase